MDQQVLFFEDINDALRTVVRECGGTKAVATKFWPEKTMNEAQSYLNDCLNPARPAKLSPEQVILLLRWGKEAGFHQAMTYLANEAGYSAQPIEPHDELAELINEYLRSRKREDSLSTKIDERIASIKAVK